MYLSVVPRSLILVLDQQPNRSTKRDSMLDTRLELDEIFLVTRGSEITLTGSATTELCLDILRFKGQTLKIHTSSLLAKD